MKMFVTSQDSMRIKVKHMIMPHIPIYEVMLTEGNTGVEVVSLVERPAVQFDFLALQKTDKFKRISLSDDERMETLGVALVANTPIYRISENYGEHYVVFATNTIRAIVQRFFREKRTDAVSLHHQIPVRDVTMFQSYIVDKRLGVVPPRILGDVPDGSWIVGHKIHNPEVWRKIKSGEVRGYSIEGMFEMAQVHTKQSYAEDIWREVASICYLLNKTKTL